MDTRNCDTSSEDHHAKNTSSSNKKRVSFDFVDPTATQDRTDACCTSEEQPPQETPPALCDLSGSMFIPIHPAPLPIKQRPELTYTSLQKLTGGTVASFHDIFRASKSASAGSTASFFYKKNQANSPFMPELEAFCWGCYHFLIPDYVPQSTRAVYDSKLRESNYTGVSSKAISNFKSTKELQLTESDLVLPILEEGITIEDIEALDHDLQNDSQFNERDDDDTLKSVCINSGTWIRVTVGDLKRFRIMKGLASGLMASYLFEEDDLHRGNMSRQGERIDFDGSLWSILSKFKSSSYLDNFFRSRNADQRFVVHSLDIQEFPNLTHASPYYWPTRPVTTSNKIATIVSSNPWNTDENKTYQMLSKNPVFNYFKFRTLLKFMLAGADIYLHIAEMHVRLDAVYQNKLIINELFEHLRDRVQKVKEVVIAMPEFAEFITKHGAIAFEKIKDDIEVHNQHYGRKGDKINETLRNLDKKKSDEIRLLAKKLNIRFHPANDDKFIKDQIILILIARKESYQHQLIDLNNVTAKYKEITRIITKKQQGEQLSAFAAASVPNFIAGLQASMKAEATPSTHPIFRAS